MFLLHLSSHFHPKMYWTKNDRRAISAKVQARGRKAILPAAKKNTPTRCHKPFKIYCSEVTRIEEAWLPLHMFLLHLSSHFHSKTYCTKKDGRVKSVKVQVKGDNSSTHSSRKEYPMPSVLTSLLKYIVARSQAFKKRDFRSACFYCISHPISIERRIAQRRADERNRRLSTWGGEDVSAFSPRLISCSLSSSHCSPDDLTTSFVIVPSTIATPDGATCNVEFNPPIN